jgi:hypothetical protein
MSCTALGLGRKRTSSGALRVRWYRGKHRKWGWHWLQKTRRRILRNKGRRIMRRLSASTHASDEERAAEFLYDRFVDCTVSPKSKENDLAAHEENMKDVMSEFGEGKWLQHVGRCGEPTMPEEASHDHDFWFWNIAKSRPMRFAPFSSFSSEAAVRGRPH